MNRREALLALSPLAAVPVAAWSAIRKCDAKEQEKTKTRDEVMRILWEELFGETPFPKLRKP